MANEETPTFPWLSSDLPTLENLTMQYTSIITNMSSLIPGISDPPIYVLDQLAAVNNSPNNTYAIYGYDGGSSSPLYELQCAIFAWILADYKVSLDMKYENNSTALLEEVTMTYNLVYGYFFLAAGLTLVMLAMLLFLGKKGKTVGEYGSVALRCVIGTALCLVVLMELQDSALKSYASNTVYDNFQESGWVLPAVMIGYVLGEQLDAHLVATISIY